MLTTGMLAERKGWRENTFFLEMDAVNRKKCQQIIVGTYMVWPYNASELE